jgi:hypothetical protein
MSAVATAMGVTLRGGRVIAEGHWDARGTLGVDRTVPIGLTDIALTFELDAGADAATSQRPVEMSERFCVIYQTLRTPPRLLVTQWFLLTWFHGAQASGTGHDPLSAHGQ